MKTALLILLGLGVLAGIGLLAGCSDVGEAVRSARPGVSLDGAHNTPDSYGPRGRHSDGQDGHRVSQRDTPRAPQTPN